MVASLNRTPKHPLQGMQRIQAKIADLQTQYDTFLKQRKQDIAHLITMLDLGSLDDQTLVGGIIFIKNKTTAHDPIVEVWRDAGERFLRRSKPRRHRQSHQTETLVPKAQSPKSSS